MSYEPEKLNLQDDQDLSTIPNEVRQQLLVTKFKHWNYEEEVRAFVSLSKAVKERGLYFYPFGNELSLREVILGHNCPKSSLKPIRALVRATNPGALVSKARLGFKYFEVKESGLYPAKA